MISIQAAVTSSRDARRFGADTVIEEPSSRPEIPSSMIENIDGRLDDRASIPEIRDARPEITAGRTDDTAEVIEIPDARSSGKADGIDEPAEGMNEPDAVIEIPDDRTNVIDAMTNGRDDRLDVIDAMPEDPARPTDQPAKRGEGPVNRIEVQWSRLRAPELHPKNGACTIGKHGHESRDGAGEG